MSRLKVSSTDVGLWLGRLVAAFFLAGQVFLHMLRGKFNTRNIIEQMNIIGPASLLICLVTAASVGMVFTIQVAREFVYFGARSAVGGVLALSLSRELTPVLTSVVLSGRVGSAFAAEIGTMQVTEQIDALYTLKTDPIDYLVTPRVVACALMTPFLTIFSLVGGILGGMVVADKLYAIPASVFLDSILNFTQTWDIVASLIKSVIFGFLLAVIGCSWGLTTKGGAKGVGQSTTTAVVTSLLAIFVTNFFLSWLMFQGLGNSSVG